MQLNRHETSTELWNPYRRVSSRGRHAQIRFSRGGEEGTPIDPTMASYSREENFLLHMHSMAFPASNLCNLHPTLVSPSLRHLTPQTRLLPLPFFSSALLSLTSQVKRWKLKSASKISFQESNCCVSPKAESWNHSAKSAFRNPNGLLASYLQALGSIHGGTTFLSFPLPSGESICCRTKDGLRDVLLLLYCALPSKVGVGSLGEENRELSLFPSKRKPEWK